MRNLVIAESCSMKVSDDGEDALYAGFVADVNHGTLERCENYGSIAHRSPGRSTTITWAASAA